MCANTATTANTVADPRGIVIVDSSANDAHTTADPRGIIIADSSAKDNHHDCIHRQGTSVSQA